MTKYRVHVFIIFKGDYIKRNFRWIRLNPETTWSAELKIKGSKNLPLRRKEKSKGRVLEGVTWCQPPGQVRIRSGHSEGEAQRDTKIATDQAQRGIKKFVQSQDGGAEGGREGGRGRDGGLQQYRDPWTSLPAHLYPPAYALTFSFAPARPTCSPGSAHINDTLVSIVTRGE